MAGQGTVAGRPKASGLCNLLRKKFVSEKIMLNEGEFFLFSL